MAPRTATLAAAALSASLILASVAGPAAHAKTTSLPASPSLPATPLEPDTVAPDPAAADAAVPDGVENPEASTQEVSVEGQGTEALRLDLDPELPTVVAATWDSGEPGLEYRAEVDGQWSDWATLELADEGLPGDADATDSSTATEPMTLVNASAIEARATHEEFEQSIELSAFSSSVTEVDREVTSAQASESPNISTPFTASVSGSVLNRVVPRSSWGARTPVCTLNKSARKYATIVHHTAGSNTYTREQVPAILRSYQAMHINKTPTWCDIGYHMLVDRWGTIYEGAGGGLGNSLVAAHAAGWNGDTFGVSVMGDFTQTTPNSAVLWSLKQIAGWQAAYWGYDPTGSVSLIAGGGGKYASGQRVTINRVLGHRDVGYTACPGSLYNYLTEIRSGAKSWAAKEPVRPTDLSATRLAGEDRYRTSVAASKQAYPNGARTAYVATGIDYADALVAAPAAAKEKAPLLLTQPGGLPNPVAAELARLKPSKIVVVGGTGAVSNTVENQLKKYAGTVVRRGGDNRYQTAARVNQGAFSFASRAYITTGLDYPDALAASALAGSYGAIVMLVPGHAGTANQATTSTLRKLGVTKAVVVGGPKIVSQGIADSLKSYKPHRVYGKDRYETARKLNESLVTSASTAYLATGKNFPDALSAAATAGAKRAPLYLTPPTCVPLAIRGDLVHGAPRRVTLVGGTGVLSQAVSRLYPC